MQVILLEKVRNLGDLGDTVDVKSGYGRNFLIPHGKAIFATEKNLANFEARRKELEKQAAEKLSDAEKRANAINTLSTIRVEALASEEGKLYGSVGPNEIAKAVNNAGIELSRRDILMPEGPIHTVGEHPVSIQLHSDIVTSLTVNVVEAK